MIESDLADFGNQDLAHRLLHGGRPPFFLAAELPERDFQEWLDAYWGDKQGHEVDFIWLPRGRKPFALECKWSARDFDPSHLLVFQRAYPKFELVVVATDAEPEFARHFGGVTIRFTTLARLVPQLAS